MAFEFVITPETNYPKPSEQPLTQECMIGHFVYVSLVHIVVIFNQAAVSFVSLKLAPPGSSKEAYTDSLWCNIQATRKRLVFLVLSS